MSQEGIFALFQSNLKLFDDANNLIHRERDPEVKDNLKLRSNLRSIDIGKYIKRPCTGTKICCEQTKSALESDFKEFMNCLQNKSGNKVKTNFNRETRNYNNEAKSTRRDKYPSGAGFVTATEELNAQNISKYGVNKYPSSSGYQTSNPCNGQKRKLGLSRGVTKKFVSPLLATNEGEVSSRSGEDWPEVCDEHLKNIDPKMVEMIRSEIMDTNGSNISWNDIAGLHYAKSVIQEAVIWPLLRPDIFNGLRRPPKGILLFGPPGTGKTLIGKCIAHQSKSTFFSISASSLTSKWIGDGEKMVRALFAVARSQQPAVIFIDEIDSLLSQRSDTEHESSRRMKTEFLIQLDGASTDSEEKLLLVGATNRPQELDEAARRRFIKRIYIPLPEYEARLELLKKLISGENHSLTDGDFDEVAKLSAGYSGADIRSLCAEASLGPIRSINMQMIEHIQPEEVRPLTMEDFQTALRRVKSSVSEKDLDHYVEWNKIFGCGM